VGVPLRVTRAIAVVIACVMLGFAADQAAISQGDSFFLQRKYEQARASYERAMASGARVHEDPLRAVRFGLSCLNSVAPDLPRAVEWLTIGVSLNPNSEEARSGLAQALTRSGRFEEATFHYRQLAATHPDNSEYAIGLGSALWQTGRKQDAVAALQKAVEQSPGSVPIRVEYARLLNFTNQFREAREQFGIVLRTHPNNVVAQVGLAKATSWEGDQEGAIAMYDRILQRRPGLYDALVGKAFALLWMGRRNEALQLLERAARHNAEDREVAEAIAAVRSGAPTPVMPAADEGQPTGTRELRSESTPGQSSPAQPQLPRAAASPTNAGKLNTKQGLTSEVLRSRGSGPAEPVRPTRSGRADPVSLGFLSVVAILLLALIVVRRRRNRVGTVPVSPVVASATDAQAAAVVPEVQARAGLVLIIGGHASVVEIERRCLQGWTAEVVAYESWVPAIPSLLQHEPALIVINALTDDGWTAPRIYHWISQNRPGFEDRAIVVLSTRDETNLEFKRNSGAACLFQPFQCAEFLELAKALSASATVPLD